MCTEHKEYAQRVCSTKTKFDCREEGQIFLEMNPTKTALRVYKCNTCDGWHLATNYVIRYKESQMENVRLMAENTALRRREKDRVKQDDMVKFLSLKLDAQDEELKLLRKKAETMFEAELDE